MLFLEHFFEIMRSAKRELHDVLLKLIAFWHRHCACSFLDVGMRSQKGTCVGVFSTYRHRRLRQEIQDRDPKLV